MGVDDEALNSRLKQMIEGKRDERFLKNGYERLGQVVR